MDRHTGASEGAADPSQESRRVGRCVIFGELARGGMATVYLGRWIGSGGFHRTVAVKALHPELANDPEFRHMFLDEARVVARIRHPNVGAIIDVIDEHGELFIVMEYVEGVTLAHLMAIASERNQPIPAAITKRILCGVLQGLHAAHEAKNEQGLPLGLIHRDVSPDNIVVGTDGYARLIDFGIARALGRSSACTRTGWVKGKLSYLAPEQVTATPLDRRADVWGASVVLWQALTGRRLFRGASPAEVLHKVLTQPITPPSALASDVGWDVDRVVLKGLARDRGARWKTAEQMSDALEATSALASYRAVGAWVQSAAGERIDQTRELVAVVERASLPDLDVETRVSQAPLPAAVARGISPTVHDEQSRTELTSQADADHPGPERSARSGVAVAILAAAVAVIAAAVVIWRGPLLRELDMVPGSGAPPPLNATREAEPIAPSSSATVEPSASQAPAPSSSAPRSPTHSPVERVKPRWRRPANPRLPSDI